MSTTNYLQMMIDSLNMKINLMKQISELNEEQQTLVLQSDMDEDAFDHNLKEKGSRIDQLDQLDEGFQNVFSRVREELENNKESYTEEIRTLKELIKEITELSVSIQAQEARNKVSVQNKFSTIRRNIQMAKRSTTMANTYYQNMNKINYEPQFMDKKK